MRRDHLLIPAESCKSGLCERVKSDWECSDKWHSTELRVFINYLHVIRVGAGQDPSGIKNFNSGRRREAMMPPLASTMKLTRKPDCFSSSSITSSRGSTRREYWLMLFECCIEFKENDFPSKESSVITLKSCGASS